MSCLKNKQYSSDVKPRRFCMDGFLQAVIQGNTVFSNTTSKDRTQKQKTTPGSPHIYEFFWLLKGTGEFMTVNLTPAIRAANV